MCLLNAGSVEPPALNLQAVIGQVLRCVCVRDENGFVFRVEGLDLLQESCMARGVERRTRLVEDSHIHAHVGFLQRDLRERQEGGQLQSPQLSTREKIHGSCPLAFLYALGVLLAVEHQGFLC